MRAMSDSQLRRARQAIEASFAEEPAMLTMDRAAELIGVSRRTIHSWVNSGQLYCVKLSQGRTGRVRIPRASIIQFLSERAYR